MGDLIVSSDLNVYPVTIEQSEALFIDRLISVASAAVTNAAGCQIKEARSTLTLLVTPGRTVRLPGAPIREVHTVTHDGEPVKGWLKTSTGLYSALAFNQREPFELTVDYTHGLVEVPLDVADLVCRMVISGLLAGRDGGESLALNNGALSSIAIDDYKEAYATGDIEAVTEMTLPTSTRRWLRQRFSGGAVVGRTL